MKLNELSKIESINPIKVCNRFELQDKIKCVYFFTDKDVITYIGYTVNLKRRLSSHHVAVSKNNIVYFINVFDGGFSIESKLIKIAKPKLNCKLGRKNISDKLDKVVPVTVYVKTRHRSAALAAALMAVKKYR